jgi:hypothetical protein
MAAVDKWGLSDPRMQGFIETYERAWAAPSAARLRELWTDDARYHLPGMPDPVEGGDAIAGSVEGFLQVCPDMNLRPTAAAGAKDTLFIQFTAGATVKGQYVEWVAVDRFDFPADGTRANRGEAFFTPSVLDGAFD